MKLPKLVEVTPEGRIAAALVNGPKSYGELRAATGLSDRWLSKKLRELSSFGLVEHKGDDYQLKNPVDIMEADPVFAKYLQEKASLRAKARLVAEEISQDNRVVAVILFGSVAKGQTTSESDIDLLIVTEEEMEDHLNNTLYNLMFKYDVPIEAVLMTYEALMINLQAKTAFSFGLLEGYQILYDRGGLKTLLAIKKKEIQENWIYDEEAQAWIQKNLIPTLKQQRSS